MIQASHKLAEEMYKNASAQQAGQAGQGGQAGESGPGGPTPGGEHPKGDGAVDADFEVVDDKDK